jgi:hypothetical protein
MLQQQQHHEVADAMQQEEESELLDHLASNTAESATGSNPPSRIRESRNNKKDSYADHATSQGFFV